VADRPDLGGFLRTRRARVSAGSVGLPGSTRRRVPGLRREELAQLAGISVEYYQRLEQGRATRPSDEVLAAVSRVLRLDEVERAHLEALARPRRAPGRSPSREVRPELRGMLALMDRVPALVVNDGFDVLAANAVAVHLFVDVATAAPEQPNLARYLFLDPRAREFYLDWAEVAAATVGQLRLATGRHPGDHELAALVAELAAGDGSFRALWAARDVEQRSSGTKSLRHPGVGVLTLHYQNFQPVDEPRQRLVTFVPQPHSASEAALHILAGWASR
jgi:transcriptional regulator with XRE-family HTH domain